MNFKTTSLYASAFSELNYYEGKDLLYAVWLEESRNLNEANVMTEISRILDAIRSHRVNYIIVDARDYAFRNNANVQNWINRTYIPMLMETGVKKYAIIVGSDVEVPVREEYGSEDIYPKVEYFRDFADAIQWL